MRDQAIAETPTNCHYCVWESSSSPTCMPPDGTEQGISIDEEELFNICHIVILKDRRACALISHCLRLNLPSGKANSQQPCIISICDL